jgi:hypothetical protein
MGRPAAAASSSHKRKLARLLSRGALAALVAFLSAEACLRFLLFSDLPPAERLGRRLRNAAYFTSWQTEEAWALKGIFEREGEGAAPHPDAHPVLGWIKRPLSGDPLRHADEALLAGRRPVLFYGDSYAGCATPAADCWQGLLEASPLGRELCLLNFGVGGYGVDQMLLLLRATIDRYAGQDPLVIVGILVDDDLDRCALGLRTWPKPRFRLEQGELVLEPPLSSAEEFLAVHPPAIRSYAWRFLLFGLEAPGPVQRALSGRHAADQRVRELSRALIEELVRELRSRDLDFFFVLFHGERGSAEVGPYTWREPFLYEVLGDLGAPFVSSKRPMLDDALAKGCELWSYFVREGPGLNHYNAEGNRVVFRAIEAGLRGEFEPAGGYLPGAPEHPRLRR